MPNQPKPNLSSKPSTPNQIDGEDAVEIGEFISAVTNEMQKYDKAEILKALSGAKSYSRVSSARIRYDMTVQVTKVNNGVKSVKDRNAEIEVQLDVNNISTTERVAPFELVNGIISPAEIARQNVEEILVENGINIKNHTLPIFAISADRYWVFSGDSHLIVDTKNNTIETLQNIDMLTDRLTPMFQFISSKLSLIY